MEGTTASPRPRYQGVRGWLLLLCLVLTVSFPLLMSLQLLGSLRAEWRLLAHRPDLVVILVADGILRAALIACSAYAGVRLWRIRPGAVRATKGFLVCLVAYSFIREAVRFLTHPTGGSLTEEAAKRLLQSFLIVAIWYSYLVSSKRVRATYGAS